MHSDKLNARVLNVGQTSHRSSVANDNENFQRICPLKISGEPALKYANRDQCLNMKRTRACRKTPCRATIHTVGGLCGETVITMTTRESSKFKFSLCTVGGQVNSCMFEKHVVVC